MNVKCKFPEKEKGILKLSEHWIQILPDGRKIKSRGNGTNGWALNPNFKFNSENDGYYPYACETGMIETQYDNASTKPFVWETQDKFIGGGDKMIRLENGRMIKAGGKQGVKFKDGKFELNSEIDQFKCKYCVSTPKVLRVVNNSKYTVTFCRVTSALEIPQIPTTIKPGEEIYLTSIPSLKDNNWSRLESIERKKYESVWWNGNQNDSKNVLTYFVSRANETDLKPVCQFNKIRPSTLEDSKKGIDYYPYILTIDRNFEVKLNSNNDLLMGTDSGYDTSLGNPKFGMRMFSSDSNSEIGSIEYSGNNHSAYSHFNGKYSCNHFKQGLSAMASTAHAPILIELFNVKNSSQVQVPEDYCLNQFKNRNISKKRIKRSISDPPNIVYIDKKERMSTGGRVVIGLILMALILILGIIIGFMIYSSIRKKRVNQTKSKVRDTLEDITNRILGEEPEETILDTDEEMNDSFNRLFSLTSD
jgi:hypothetical protein